MASTGIKFGLVMCVITLLLARETQGRHLNLLLLSQILGREPNGFKATWGKTLTGEGGGGDYESSFTFGPFSFTLDPPAEPESDDDDDCINVFNPYTGKVACLPHPYIGK